MSSNFDAVAFLDDAIPEILSSAAQINIWQPDPDNEPQCLAYELAGQVDELGYGGQAGGGKTDLALGLAGTLFTNSLILRREFPQLEGIIDRGNELYPASFVYGIKRRWEFNNRIITLGSLQHDKDWRKYQGRARQFIAFDEAAEFPEETVRKVTGWVRGAPGENTLVLYTFNPPTTLEGRWIVEYFAPWLDPNHPNPAAPGEIRWFAFITDEHGRDKSIEVEGGTPFVHNGVEIAPISRTFIPASRTDNKYLGAEYVRRLNNLPEPLRTMLRDGVMEINPVDDEWQIIPTAWVLEAQNRWEAMRPSQEDSMTALGVDVARGGQDNTVLAPLFGTWFDELSIFPGSTTPDGRAVRDQVLKVHQVPAKIGVDVVGWGASAYDHLKPLKHLKVYALNAGSKGHGRDHSGKLTFSNLRARMWWLFREALDPDSGKNIALPPDPQLLRELTAVRYSVAKEVIKVEAKEDLKKRLGSSPDRADAVIMAWEVRQRKSATMLLAH